MTTIESTAERLRLPTSRTEHDLLIGIAQLLEESLAELRHIRATLGQSAGASSVEIKTSTRGVDVTTKVYSGSPVIEAESEAVTSYFRTINAVQDRLMNGQAVEPWREAKKV